MHAFQQIGLLRRMVFTCFSMSMSSELALDQVDILFGCHGNLCVDVPSWFARHVKISDVFEGSIHYLHQELHIHHCLTILGLLHLESGHLISICVGQRQHLRLIHCAPRGVSCLGTPLAVLRGDLQDTLPGTARVVHQHQPFRVGGVA
eukprot:Skav223129  [mRNA]  locus=scaffold470:65982:66425:- [translate_table: standard]